MTSRPFSAIERVQNDLPAAKQEVAMPELKKMFLPTAAACAALMVAACGGSETSDSADTAESAANDVEQAAESTAAAVETAAADASAAAAEGADEAEEAIDKVGNAMTAASDDAGEAVESAMNDGKAMAEKAVADAGEKMEAVAASAQDAAASAYASLTGDAAAGKRVFAKCMACHTVVEGQNRVGPSLYGIVGREAGSVEGFNYSDANANSGLTWTEATLFEYLEAPQEFMPGTRMIFPGLPSEQDRANVIAYLKSAAE